MKRESQFQREVKSFLLKRGAVVIRTIVDPLGESGGPDLIVCYKGKFVGLELKTGTKASVLQLARIKQIQRAGGIGLVFKYHEGGEKTLMEEIDND